MTGGQSAMLSNEKPSPAGTSAGRHRVTEISADDMPTGTHRTLPLHGHRDSYSVGSHRCPVATENDRGRGGQSALGATGDVDDTRALHPAAVRFGDTDGGCCAEGFDERQRTCRRDNVR